MDQVSHVRVHPIRSMENIAEVNEMSLGSENINLALYITDHSMH